MVKIGHDSIDPLAFFLVSHKGQAPSFEQCLNTNAYVIKGLPSRTIEVTSSVAASTTKYVHINAFDLVLAQM